MQKLIYLSGKIIRFAFSKMRTTLTNLISYFLLYVNNVSFHNIRSNGIPYIMIARGGICKIGKNFKMNNGIYENPIGRTQPCMLIVDKGATLTIGNNVGISSTAIVTQCSIAIGNNVKIGGGVCIYDTDFHSIDSNIRKDKNLDTKNKISKAVIIKDNVFIGAHSTILKGITIGENSIIGACSVVTKDIPQNEIWGGNPAHFIKHIGF